jgi:hypothetical protein
MSHPQAGCDPLSGFVKAQVGGGNELKKFMLMAALVAVVVAALALPALAQNRLNNNNSSWDNNSRFNDNNNGWDNWWNNRPWDNNNRFNDNNSGVSQRNEQQVQSGDSSQTFNVTGGGDNSNVCQGIQGISNTGNAVNSTNVLQYASEGGVGVSDSGNFTISPSQSTTCKQSVNQAATASG